jgi:hypothetical protein
MNDKNMEMFVKLLLKYIHEYQIVNNIKLNCFTHTLYFMDACNKKIKDYCKYEVGCVFYIDKDNNIRTIVHCWCNIDGKIIEPSYDVSSIPYKKVYYNSIKKIFSSVEGLSDDVKKYIVKQVSWFNIQFLKCLNNFSFKTDNYDKLQDFILKKFNSKIEVK